MDRKKRKVDSENRKFQHEWTEMYCFVLPNYSSSTPMCLICQETVALVKSGNIKRHYETKHKIFHEKYPLGSELRKSIVTNLLLSFIKSTQTVKPSLTMQEKLTEASLRICWTLNKNQRPFSDADIVRECIDEAAIALFDDKKEVVDALCNIPLSTSNIVRQTEILARVNFENVINCIQNSDYYSLALDQSCDITDVVQVLVFIRFYDKTSRKFYEEFLTILSLKDRTCGVNLYGSLTTFLKSVNIDISKITSITTDGAPLMLEEETGLVPLLKKDNPDLISYHCIIHQSDLCCKLIPELQTLMQTVIKLINFLRARSSLKHREFPAFLKEVNAQYDDLLLHNNVRWLSKGLVMERLWAIRSEIKVYLGSLSVPAVEEFTSFLENESNMASVAFLTDTFRHLNELNVKIEGKNKMIFELISIVKSFRRKLDVFQTDLNRECSYFPTLKSLIGTCDSRIETRLFSEFIEKLKAEFDKRFTEFCQIECCVQLLIDLYTLQPSGKWCDQLCEIFGENKSFVQMEIIELQEDIVLKTKQNDPSVSLQEFWSSCVSSEKYPILRSVALRMCTMFGSTCICESAFSKINLIESKHRSRLTDEYLQHVLRISCTNFNVDLQKLAREKISHSSRS